MRAACARLDPVRADHYSTAMKIATWNINGVKARIDVAVTWLKEAEPDVACFQEIKSTTE